VRTIDCSYVSLKELIAAVDGLEELDGFLLALTDGFTDGIEDGLEDGETLGEKDGCDVGILVGFNEGKVDG